MQERRIKSEHDLQTKVIKAFRYLGLWCKYNSPDLDPGRFDLLACGPGMYLWIELKSESGELRPQQRAWAIEYHRDGGDNLYFLKPVDGLFQASYVTHLGELIPFKNVHAFPMDAVREMLHHASQP